MLSHNIPVDVIFLDYEKAFDTVPHERPLKKVSTLGIKGNLLNWLRGFLTGRKQRVIINSATSNWDPVTSGVPQGSVLGPLLFLMFVHDIPNEIRNFISLFADDTKIFAAVHDQTDTIEGTIQHDLNALQDWATKMQMRSHPQKCKVMNLGTQNSGRIYTMKTHDGNLYKLDSTDSERDLGVLVDHGLTFSLHIGNQVNRANRVLGAIKHTFKYMDEVTFLLLCKSLVRPHLEYASVIWSPHLKKDKDAIERVQRRATRMVTSITHLTYSERLAHLKLPTLEFRRDRADIIQLFKISQGIDHIESTRECNICGRITYQPSLSSTTRGHHMKYQIQHNSSLRHHIFPIRTFESWNKLTSQTISCRTVGTFKNHLAKEWREHPKLYSYGFSY